MNIDKRTVAATVKMCTDIFYDKESGELKAKYVLIDYDKDGHRLCCREAPSKIVTVAKEIP